MDTARSLSRRSLVLLLFERLDACGIRYVALHSYESLPDDLPSDLDMAVHPDDMGRLAAVFADLRERGYTAVQSMNYAVDGYYFVFFWPEAESLRALAIDFTCHHREGGLILMPGKELVDGRLRHGSFWIPRPETEFGYLLAKKALKGTLPDHQAGKLRQLADQIGRPAAEEVAARWFGQAWKTRVVDACISGEAAAQIVDLQRQLHRTMRRRDPLNPLRHGLTEIPRLVRRLLRPVGLWVAVLGPDGSGKSTLVSEMTRQIQPAFRSTRIFHWRPFVLSGRRRTIIADPHGMPVDNPVWSVVRLLGHLLDYWFGYLVRIRPALTRAGLVVFDRYFQDILADPRRYRYGGPRWLVRLAGRLIAKPDLVLILDAPEEIVIARKQEVAPEEVRRQRHIYRELAGAFPRTSVLDAAAPSAEVSRQACAIATRFLVSRLARQAGRFGFHDNDGGGLLQDALGCVQCPPSETGRVHTFSILPSRRNPRWLLPLGDSRATLQALRSYTPYQRRARVLQSGLDRLIATGSDLWARHRISLPPGSLAGLESLVAITTGEERPLFGFSLGTPSRARKLTVQAMRPDGASLGYIKLPLTGEAAARVRHEAATLERLRRFHLLRPHLPEVLFAGEWQGRYILFQSPGGGKPGPVRCNGLHTRFLENLRRATAVQRSGAALVDEAAAQWDQTAGHLDPPWRQLGRDALQRAARELRGTDVACGVWHGDFAPWNTRARDGRLFVFDWESAEWDMPVWWDLFHFDLQVASLLEQSSGIDLERLDAPAWNSLYLLYLLRSVSRTVEDGSGAQAIEYRRKKLVGLLQSRSPWKVLEAIHVGSRY